MQEPYRPAPSSRATDERLQFLGIDAEECRRLRALGPELERARESFVEGFYAHLMRFEDTAGFLRDPEVLERLKVKQGEYFNALTCGSYGQDYVTDRLRVGTVHQQIGLEPRWYIGAYCGYLCGLLPRLRLQDGGFFEACRALLRVVFYDMGWALETYSQARRHDLASIQEPAVELQLLEAEQPARAPKLADIEAETQRLVEQLELGTPDLGAREAFLGLSPQDSANLELCANQLGSRLEKRVRTWARALEASLPETQRSVHNPRFSSQALEFFQRLFAGRSEASVLPSRVRLGVLVQRLGWELWRVVAAMARFLEGVLEDLCETSGLDAPALFCSVLKVACLDLGLIIDAAISTSEQPLRALKDFATSVVESVPSGLLLLDHDLRVISANASGARLIERSLPELAGMPLAEVLPVPRIIELARRVQVTRTPQPNLFFDVTLGTRKRLFRATISPLSTDPGVQSPAQLLVVLEDLSEVERLQTAVLESERRFENLVEGLDAIVCEADAHAMRCLFVNDRAVDILGYSKALWHGDGFFFGIIHPADRARIRGLFSGALPDYQRYECRLMSADGRTFWFQSSTRVVRDILGQPKTLRSIHTDVTALKAAEAAVAEAHKKLRGEQAKLVQAEKLSSIGMLAAGVAHEINNPLSGVLGCVKALRAGKVPKVRQDEYFTTVLDGLERMQRTVKGLLDFARRRPTSIMALDAHEAVVASLRLIEPSTRRKRVQVECQLKPGGLILHADRAEVIQALVNLLLNAVYAVGDEGRITVSAQHDPPLAAICVQDDGPGIPERNLARICDPFFTTKPEGHGTGLGLTVTLSIARAHGGRLEFANVETGGAMARLFIPVSRRKPDVRDPARR